MADRKPPKREPRKIAPAPRFTLTPAWAAALIALLVVIFFHEVSVGGKTFVAPDTTAPAGFVRMGEKALWQEHTYPLWNPYVFLGMPSFGSGAYNPLIYPPDWPLALIAKVIPLPDMTWLLLYYALGGGFMVLLAREWGARTEGALLGGAAFVFAPNLVAVGSHGHGSQLVDSAYLPLMLWLASRWIRRGGLAHLGWLALAGGFQMLRGHVQICFYTWFAIGLFALVDFLATLRSPGQLGVRAARAAGIALAAALAFGLAGFYNLPLRDYARYSIRGGGQDGGVGMEYATQWSLAPYELPSIVVPGWVGFGGATYWGGMPFTDYPNAYLGMVAVVLALPAFMGGGSLRVFALLLAALSLLVAFGKNFPLYGFLYAHLPLFNKFRIPVMVVVLLQVAAALATAWGWSAALAGGEAGTKRPRALERLLGVAASVLLVSLVAGLLGQDAWRGPYIRAALAHHPSFSTQLAGVAYVGFVADLTRACLLGILALGVAWLATRGRWSPALTTGAALLLLLVELWPVSGRLMRPVIGETVPHALDVGRDDVTDFLEQAGPPGSFRVLPTDEDGFRSNRFAGFGIASVGGYHAAKPRLFQDFLEADLVVNVAWMRLLNVRYLVTAQPYPSVPAYLRLAHTGSQVVYENLLALPRATVVGAYAVVTPARAILDSVREGRHDNAGFTYLEQDPGLTLGPVGGARATIVSYRLNDVAVDVETPGPGLLRLADLWYPDWIATVGGRPARILKADYLLRAVAVPAGRHRVEFHYRSPAVRHGLLLSLGSLVAVLALLGLGWWRARPPASLASTMREPA